MLLGVGGFCEGAQGVLESFPFLLDKAYLRTVVQASKALRNVLRIVCKVIIMTEVLSSSQPLPA